MLINLFGQEFRQTGIMVKSTLLGGTEGDDLKVSATGAGGSFVSCAAIGAGDGTTTIPCSELSPISNSNLLRIKEVIATTAEVRLVSSIAVYV